MDANRRQIAPRTGVLVCNVGTPDAPEEEAVRRYLREFLWDREVLDMNPAARWLLLHLVILPRRPARSAEAYRAIWTEQGSPLLVHGRALTRALSTALGPEHPVELAMRYGRPCLEEGLASLRDAGSARVVVAPLFPQRAASTTGSMLSAVARAAARVFGTDLPPLLPIGDFYDHPSFIAAFEAVARPVLDELRPEHVLMSFHGLPERHIRKADPSGRHCLVKEACCDTITGANRACYRAQCAATARLLAQRLGLAEGTWRLAFQSRLGRTPWIRPYAVDVVREMARRGVQRVAVVCPSFVVDCLETLEEVGIGMARELRAAGGGELRLIPSLNAHPLWVKALADMVKRAAEVC